MLERDVEKYLVRRVKELGGECRKISWIGRSGAPDRLVMLPGGRMLFVELKRPGLAATFPADAHERAQHREHRRMRKMGQIVVVSDSIDGVDGLLT